MGSKSLIARGLQRYWRLSRGLTMGAQGCVLDQKQNVLLVRHGYRPGWHFPGGGVERRETAEQALARELQEEAGVVIDGRPALFGVYANERLFPGDHILLYVVTNWRQPVPPKPNREIAEVGFFQRSNLPADVHPSTRLRIDEILDGRRPALLW